MKVSQADYLSAYKCAIGETSELLPLAPDHLDKYAFPLLQHQQENHDQNPQTSSQMARSNAQIHRNFDAFEEQKHGERTSHSSSAFPPTEGQNESGHTAAGAEDLGDFAKTPMTSRSASTSAGVSAREKEGEGMLGLEKVDSLRTIDPAPKRVSELNLNLDIGEMWDIHSQRLTKSLRSTEKPAANPRTPKKQLQRLNSLGKVVSTKLARMSPKKSADRSHSTTSKSFRSPCEVDEARVEQTATAAGLQPQSDPNLPVPRRKSSRASGSPSLSAYRSLFSHEEDHLPHGHQRNNSSHHQNVNQCTWEQVDLTEDGERAPRRRKSMMPVSSGSGKSRMTPLEKKLGYGGMAPLIGNAIAGSFYRKTRSKSFTNRREKGFMGYSQSRSTTFMKEFEMDSSRSLQATSSSSRSSKSSFSGSLRSKSLVLRKKSSSASASASEALPPPESVEDRRSDFERKALEYNFNYHSENLRNDRESYLAYRAKLNRTSSFRNDREQRATGRYNHLRSHSFTNGLPEIHEDVLTMPPHPNKDNTTNDNIKSRARRNPVAA